VKLSAYGITTDLPPGWEGRITKRTAPARASAPVPSPSGAAGEATPGPRGTPGEVPNPVVHLANFALPEQRGDFGSGAVDLMGPDHVFVTLFEYGPESVGQALFSDQGMPTLRPSMFSPTALQRTIRGQAGHQRFFTVADRAFSLYVVLGSHARAAILVPRADRTLRATRISPR